MNKLLIILLLFTNIAKGNCIRDTVPTGVPQLFGSKFYEFKSYVLTDSFIMNAAGDTNLIPYYPSIKFKSTNNRWYGWNRSRWIDFLNSLDTISLSNRIIGIHSTFANNGLSKSGDTVQLGQVAGDIGNPAILNSAREIPLNGFAVSFTGSGSISVGAVGGTNPKINSVATGGFKAINATAVNGTGVNVVTTGSGTGIFSQVTGTGAAAMWGDNIGNAGYGIKASSFNNGVIPFLANVFSSNNTSDTMVVAEFRRNASGGGTGNGIGMTLLFDGQTTTSTNVESGQIRNGFSTALHSSHSSYFSFWLKNNTVSARKALLASTGQWTWDGYPALTPQTDTTNIKPLGFNTTTGLIQPMANWVGSGGSVTLNNIGSGYRWVATSGGNLKTSFAGYGNLKDSTTNTNGITDKVDTTTLKSVYVPLNLNANKTVNQAGYSIYYTGSGQDKFDSTIFTPAYSSPFIGADSLVSFGNSITFGSNASVPDSNYAHRTAAAFGVPLVNKGVSGTVAYQACASSLAYINPGHTAIQTFCIGLNDFRTYGGGVNEYNGVKNAYEAAMQNQFLASYVSASDGTVTRYGSWTTNYNAVSGSGGKTTTAAYSNTLNDSLVVNVTGTSIALGVIGLYTTGRDCIVYVDGVRVDSFSTSNQCFLGAYAYQSMGKYYTGFSSGSHHVKLKVGPGGTFLLVDYIGTMVSAASMKPFIFIHIPHMDATGYAGGNATAAILDHENDSLTAAYNRAKTAGLNVYLAQTNNYYVATTSSGLSSDHIHPNDKGHGQIAAAVLAGMNTSKTYPGTVTYSNDGHFYGAYTDSSRKQIAYATDLTLQKVISNSGILSVPNTISGYNTLDFTGFSRLSINNFVVNNTANQAYMHGNLGVQGASGGVSVLSRTGDTTTGYQYYSSGAITSLQCLINGKDIYRVDSSLRIAFYGRYNNAFAPTATLDIGGNNTGVAGQIPFKIEKCIRTATPEAYGWEPDSLYVTWSNGASTPVRDTIAMRRWARTGTATNDDAAAGNIGEEMNSTVSTYTNYTTSATYQNITSITLTAGDWDISAQATFSSNAATITAAGNAIFVISTTTASAAGATEGKNITYIPQAALLGTSFESATIAPYRVSISGSTTYYLNSQATFTIGNPQFVGTIRARRMR